MAECQFCGTFIVMQGGTGYIDLDSWKPKCKKSEQEPPVHVPMTGHGDVGEGGSPYLRSLLSTLMAEGRLKGKRTGSKTSADTLPPRSRSRSTATQANGSQENLGAPLKSGDGRVPMALEGHMIREQREKLGWKRPLLAEKSGLTIAQIAGIETGRALKPGEEEKLRAALQLGAEDQVRPNGTVAEPSNEPTTPLPVEEDPLVFTGENPAYAEKLDAFQAGELPPPPGQVREVDDLSDFDVEPVEVSG